MSDMTFAPLADYVAFYAGLMDEVWVGDVRVLPRPGDFYAVWDTPNLTGKIKGAPGTAQVRSPADYPPPRTAGISTCRAGCGAARNRPSPKTRGNA